MWLPCLQTRLSIEIFACLSARIRKIRQVLPFELEPSLPVAIDNLLIDYQVNDRSDETELLAAAMHRDKFNETMAALAEVDIHPQLVVPGDFPLASVCLAHFDHLPDEALLLSIGNQRLDSFHFGAQKNSARALFDLGSRFRSAGRKHWP